MIIWKSIKMPRKSDYIPMENEGENLVPNSFSSDNQGYNEISGNNNSEQPSVHFDGIIRNFKINNKFKNH